MFNGSRFNAHFIQKPFKLMVAANKGNLQPVCVLITATVSLSSYDYDPGSKHLACNYIVLNL